MFMNDLTKTRLFALLSEPSQTVLTNELRNAYGNFEEHLNATCGSNDNTAVYRSLSVTIFALSLSGFILGADGKPAPLIQIARVFEHAFNVSFGNVRERKAQIFRRISCDKTKTLNILKTCIDREYIKHNAMKT